ncbi:MAG: hypothetical protein KJ667_05115 [Alphaproteobacteria bacterium]|nr:hypothetical protein [Alphaproteobacteria bacterium]
MSSPIAAHANSPVTPAMQSCTTNDECVLSNTACGTGCNFTPLNKLFSASIENSTQSTCGAPNTTICTMHPPLRAACINARCTIDYSVSGNADERDYVGDTAPVTPTPRVEPQATINEIDKSGNVTANYLPAEAVTTEGTLGTLTIPQP